MAIQDREIYYKIYGSTSSTGYYGGFTLQEEETIRCALKPIEQVLEENPELKEDPDGYIRGSGLVINNDMRRDFGTGEILEFRRVERNHPYTHQAVASSRASNYYYHENWFESVAIKEKVEPIKEAKFDPEELVD